MTAKRTPLMSIPDRQTLSGSNHKIAVTIHAGANLWVPRSIAEQPEVTLRHWKIIEIEDKPDDNRFGRHFVGFNVEDQEGRVSSKIVEFDSDAMRGVTRSGRVYQLDGKAGSHPDAEFVLRAWLRGWDVDKHKVVELEAVDG